MNWLSKAFLIRDIVKWALPVHTLEDTFRYIENGIIEAPQGFVESDEQYLFFVCNGCGAATAKFDFVPDSLYRLCITSACHPHDFEYEHAYTLGQKLAADEMFKRNIHALIDCDRSWWRDKDKMKSKFDFYYTMVRKAGIEALEKKRFLHNQIEFNKAQGLPIDFNIDEKTLNWDIMKNEL